MKKLRINLGHNKAEILNEEGVDLAKAFGLTDIDISLRAGELPTVKIKGWSDMVIEIEGLKEMPEPNNKDDSFWGPEIHGHGPVKNPGGICSGDGSGEALPNMVDGVVIDEPGRTK